MKTHSMLLSRSAEPPVTDWPLTKALPRQVSIPLVTVKSRSLTRAVRAERVAGTSLQERTIRSGLDGSATGILYV